MSDAVPLDPLETAIVIAVRAHAGQRDDDGSPYVLHPLRVMSALARPATAEQRMAAVLHDTLEQTAVTRADLLAAGIPQAVVEAVEILTRPADESRLSATARAARNHIARAVKRADIVDNMDLSRIPEPQPADHARMHEYRQALALLDGAADADAVPPCGS